jgi:glycosyltransferase involved in cell wall biosynthesis
MISVCMAVYNGERFIKAQVESILSQLASDDELVVVNDCSHDRSVQLLTDFGDSRISLVHNSTNLGPSASFERAISVARGRVIFLADQDDVWAPTKVQTVCEIFRSIDCLVVCSDARIIDANESVIQESLFALRGGRAGFWRNLYKNGFVGCCMALRSDAKGFFMPFPRGVGMHDEWIGLCSSLAGLVYFSEGKLIDYRRHERNVTQLIHGSVSFMVRKRLKFLFLVSCRLPRILLWRYKRSRRARDLSR